VRLLVRRDIARRVAFTRALADKDPGVTVWVTFPHDASLSDGQPEIPARVVRCDEVLEVIRAANARERVPSANASEQERSAKLHQLPRASAFSDAPATFAVAFQFESQPSSSLNGHAQRSESERRNRVRKALAIPIRVHPEQIPWFEEAMTLEVSEKGMRFRSQREYASGDRLKIAFANPASAPWHGNGEFLCEVVRITPILGSAALEVSVFRVE